MEAGNIGPASRMNIQLWALAVPVLVKTVNLHHFRQPSHSVKGKSRPGTHTEHQKAGIQGWPSLCWFDTCYGVFLSSVGCSEPDPRLHKASSGTAVPRARGAQHSALPSRTSARCLCYCWVLFLLHSFPGDLKSNYKKKKKKKIASVCEPTAEEFFFINSYIRNTFFLIICFALGWPFFKYYFNSPYA